MAATPNNAASRALPELRSSGVFHVLTGLVVGICITLAYSTNTSAPCASASLPPHPAPGAAEVTEPPEPAALTNARGSEASVELQGRDTRLPPLPGCKPATRPYCGVANGGYVPPGLPAVVGPARRSVVDVVAQALSTLDPTPPRTCQDAGAVPLDASVPAAAAFLDRKSQHLVPHMYADAASLCPAFRAFEGHRSAIAIVTGWGGNHRRSASIAAASVFNKVLYARRWGHDLYVNETGVVLAASGIARSGRKNPRHPQWAKPLMVLQLLPHHEFVVWCDLDMFYTNFARSYEALIYSTPPAGGSMADAPADFIIAKSDFPVLTSVNTGHYVARRSGDAEELLRRSWHQPQSTWMFNDQGALRAELSADTGYRTRRLWRHVAIVATRELGGWAHWPVWDEFQSFRYSDFIMHFSLCSEASGCEASIAHGFIVSLALNGLFSGTVPRGLLANDTEPPALVVAPGTFGNTRKRIAPRGQRVTVVPMQFRAAGGDARTDAWLRQWKGYCVARGWALHDGSPRVVFSKYDPQPAPMRGAEALLQAQYWLALSEWVLLVDWDVLPPEANATVDWFHAAASSNTTDVIGAPTADGAWASSAVLLRRSATALNLLQAAMYSRKPPPKHRPLGVHLATVITALPVAAANDQASSANASSGIVTFTAGPGPYEYGAHEEPIDPRRVSFRQDFVAVPAALCTEVNGTKPDLACAGQDAWLRHVPEAVCTNAANACRGVWGS